MDSQGVARPALEPVEEAWLHEAVFVFEGKCTCCSRNHSGVRTCDKEFMRDAVLGLYTEMLQMKKMIGEETIDDATSFARSGRILRAFVEHKVRIFPEYHTPRFAQERVGGRRTLFGKLAADIEAHMQNGVDFSEHVVACMGEQTYADRVVAVRSKKTKSPCATSSIVKISI